MTAVATLVNDAAFDAQVLGQDQTLSSGDAQLLLRKLNRMLDSWSNEKQMIYSNTAQTFLMTPSVATYSTSLLTLGRPVSIDSMTVTLDNIDYPVDMIDLLKWNSITYKLTEAIPNQCYYNANIPNGEFNFYPRPYAQFLCTVYASYQLAQVPLILATNLVLPPGYEAAIVAGLAVEAWNSFKSGDPAPSMIKKAIDTRAVIKRTNFQPLEMETPFDHNDGDISNAFLYKGF